MANVDQRLSLPDEFGPSVSRCAMAEAKSKTSAVIVLAPRLLSKEERAAIVDELRRELPQDVGIIALQDGFKVTVVGDGPVALVSADDLKKKA
jgi:hypothetical protein